VDGNKLSKKGILLLRKDLPLLPCARLGRIGNGSDWKRHRLGAFWDESTFNISVVYSRIVPIVGIGFRFSEKVDMAIVVPSKYPGHRINISLIADIRTRIIRSSRNRSGKKLRGSPENS
jgi:hypothetical protein